ncbi:MAG: MaoC family dehydratase [Frankiaceae bacterium]
MGRVAVAGPWLDDLSVGQVLDDAPPVTVTSAHAVTYQAITGDRLRLALDGELSRRVTGRPETLVNPMLVTNLAIGQSTGFTQRVRANLFYRQLVLLHQVFVGDTLTTTTGVVAVKENKAQQGKPPTGLAVLRVCTRNQHDEPVLDFYRCPMLPLSSEAARTGRSDSLDVAPAEIDLAAVGRAVSDWLLDAYVAATPGPRCADLRPGDVLELEPADVVTGAVELAHMTLNIAAAHYDSTAGPYGRRLVYGGHTIGVAAAQAGRVLSGMGPVLAWRRCDHVGPVFEGDELVSTVTVGAVHPLRDGAGLVELQVMTTARGATGGNRTGAGEPGRPVLDWELVALI